MEFAAYIYDAWAYERANQEPQELPQLVDLRSQFQRASAIAIASLGLYSGVGIQPLSASHVLEPSVNSAPWCNHLYLCDTNYISEVQNLLERRGFDVGVIDGVYGQQTKQAVIAFQRTQRELAIDGIPGAETLRLLRQSPIRPNNPPSNAPSNSNTINRDRPPITVRPNPEPTLSPVRFFSEDIGNLQILLKERGFYLGEVDGIQGQSTTNAIIKAQQAYGLVEDGLVGPSTIRALLAAGSDVGIVNLPALVQRRSPNPQELTNLQNLLRERGFYEGANSGVYDIRTRDSILKAQRAYKLNADGEFTPQLLVALTLQKNSNPSNPNPPSNSRSSVNNNNGAVISSRDNNQNIRTTPSSPASNPSPDEPQAPVSSQNLPIPPSPSPAPPS